MEREEERESQRSLFVFVVVMKRTVADGRIITVSNRERERGRVVVVRMVGMMVVVMVVI